MVLSLGKRHEIISLSKNSRSIGYSKIVNIHLNVQLLRSKPYREARIIHGVNLAIECVYLFNGAGRLMLLSQSTM